MSHDRNAILFNAHIKNNTFRVSEVANQSPDWNTVITAAAYKIFLLTFLITE